jgi:hypothetical protein
MELPSRASSQYGEPMYCGRILLLWIALPTFWALIRAHAADPHIEKIERFGTNQNRVVLYFATIPDRTTALQYAEDLRPPVQWITLDTYPPDRDPLQYLVADTPTNRVRFYRLRITE